jgi:hypothetical protein
LSVCHGLPSSVDLHGGGTPMRGPCLTGKLAEAAGRAKGMPAPLRLQAP